MSVSNEVLFTVLSPDPVEASGGVVQVYSREDPSTVIDALPNADAVQWLEELNGPGGGSFRLSISDPQLAANPNILDYGNVVRCFLDGVPRAAFIIENKTLLATSSEENAGRFWEVSGRGAAALLDNAVVYPEFGIRRYSAAMRQFNFASDDYHWFADEDWGLSTAVKRQDAVTGSKDGYPKNYPSGGTYWIWGPGLDGNLPQTPGFVYFRARFSIPTAMTLGVYASCDDACEVYIDGEMVLLMGGPLEWQKTHYNVITLDAGEHLIAVRAENVSATYGDTPAAFLSTGFELDANGNPTGTALWFTNGWKDVGYNSWKSVAYPDPPPGWNPNELLSALLAEASERGVSGVDSLVLPEDLDIDADGLPWGTFKVDRQVEVGTPYLQLVQELGESVCDWEVTPSLELKFYLQRGTDKSLQTDDTQPVIFRRAHNLMTETHEGSFEVKNQAITKYKDGWREYTDSDSSLTWGRREFRADISQATSDSQVDRVMTYTFTKYGTPSEAITLDVVSVEEHRPYEDWGVGDYVLVPDETGAFQRVRVLGLAVTLNENGQPSFTPEVSDIKRETLETLDRWSRARDVGSVGARGSIVSLGSTSQASTGTGAGAMPGGTQGTSGSTALVSGESLNDLGDVNTAGKADGTPLVYQLAGDVWVPGGADGIRDRAYHNAGGALDDQFNDSTIDPDWTIVTPSGTHTVTEGGDVLSVKVVSNTAAHAPSVLRPMGDFAVGDYIETAVKVLAPDANYLMAGPIITDGVGTSANAVWLMPYNSTTEGLITYSLRGGTLSNIATTHYSITHRETGRGLLYLRLTYVAVDTWRAEYSPDGVSWTTWGQGDFTFALNPTHVGLATSTWGGTTDAIASYEFFRTSVPAPVEAPPPVVYSDEVMADSPVAYWRLDETSGTTAADSSGNANDGTYTNTPTLGAAALVSGGSSAVDFDGTDDRVSTTLSGPATVISAEAWVRLDNIGASESNAIVSTHYGTDAAGNGRWVELFMFSSGTANQAAFRFALDPGGGAGLDKSVTSPTEYATGTTHHVVGTYDGTTLRLYVDGVEVDSLVATIANFQHDVETVTLGARAGGSALHFDGAIDEAAVYGTALSASRVLTHYLVGSGASDYETEVMTDGPVGYWAMNETSGTVVEDASGNNLDGALGPTWPSTLGLSPLITSGTSYGLNEGATGQSAFSVPDTGLLDFTGSMTLEVWVQITNADDDLGFYIIDKARAATGNSSYSLYWDNRTSQGAPKRFRFLLDNVYLEWIGGTEMVDAFAAGCHLAAVWDAGAGTAHIYLNGVERATSALSPSLLTANALDLLVVSAWAGNTIAGKADQAAVYDTALSAARILAHYNEGIA